MEGKLNKVLAGIPLPPQQKDGVMSIYTYECEDCDNKEDRIFPINTAPIIIGCSQCLAPMKRIISGNVNLVFKGKGWTEKFHKRS